MPRTSEDRLQLFDKHVATLIGETGSHATWSVSWHQEGGVSTTEPGRESLRSWLMTVRLLDDPKSDVHLQTIMDDIDALAESDVTHQRIAILRQRRSGPMSPG